MQYEEQNVESSIDLMAVLVTALRKWKWLVVMVLIGAVLLGGYEFLRPAPTTVNESQVQNAQNAIDKSESTLQENETEMLNIAFYTQTNEARIAESEQMCATYQSTQKMLEDHWKALQASVEQIEAVLKDPNLTAEQAMTMSMQLSTLSGNMLLTNDRLNALAGEIKAANDAIADLQVENYNMENRRNEITAANEELLAQIGEQKTQLETLQAGTPQRKSTTTYVLIGGIAGAFIFCCVVFLQCVLDKRLRTAADLEEQYRLPVLGEFYSEKAKRHKKGFDKMLDRMMGDGQTLPEEQDVYERVAAVVSAEAQMPTCLAVTGTAPRETLEAVAEKLSGLLPEQITVETRDNPVYDTDFLAQIKNYTILLVEAKGVSNRKEISRLVALLRRSQAAILGAVVR